MKKILLFIALFLLGLVLFMPKVNLFYTLEGVLKKEHIVIKEQSLKDRWVDLSFKKARVLYDGIESLQAERVSLSPWLFYNKVSAYDVEPSAALKSMLNVHADSVVLTYSVLDYKHVAINAKGDFGEIKGSANIFSRELRVVLTPSEKFKNSPLVKNYFKKEKEGLVYASKF